MFPNPFKMRCYDSIFRPIWLKCESAKFQVITACWGKNGRSSLFLIGGMFREHFLVTSKGTYQQKMLTFQASALSQWWEGGGGRFDLEAQKDFTSVATIGQVSTNPLFHASILLHSAHLHCDSRLPERVWSPSQCQAGLGPKVIFR